MSEEKTNLQKFCKVVADAMEKYGIEIDIENVYYHTPPYTSITIRHGVDEYIELTDEHAIVGKQFKEEILKQYKK